MNRTATLASDKTRQLAALSRLIEYAGGEPEEAAHLALMLWEERDKLQDELLTSLAEMERLQSLLAAAEAAAYLVCPEANREGWADDDGRPAPKFVCLNEDGDPIIEAETVAEVINGMAECWSAMQERLERKEARVTELEAHLRDNYVTPYDLRHPRRTPPHHGMLVCDGERIERSRVLLAASPGAAPIPEMIDG
jgi:hypothetical protein